MSNKPQSPGTLRLAKESDIPALQDLIPVSVHALQSDCYSSEQRNAALGPVFGVDSLLIRDGTYFVVEELGGIIACGGWSRRRSLFGSSSHRGETNNGMMDPRCEPARVRAFFVHPDWARRGLGKRLLLASEEAIRDAGFHRVELVATLAGEPLYSALGYQAMERYEVPLREGLGLPVVRMTKTFLEQMKSPRLKLLFVCSRNKRRSLTAEHCFAKSEQYEVRSAGTQPEARIRLTPGLIGWADIILFMERSHQKRAEERFAEALENKRALVLNIPDEYEYMSPELIEELETKVALALER